MGKSNKTIEERRRDKEILEQYHQKITRGSFRSII
jgi:hypothetical protein